MRKELLTSSQSDRSIDNYAWCKQALNLQTELNYLDCVNIFNIFGDLAMTPLTQPPTQQNKKPTHGWGNLHRFQIFKQN